MEQLQKTLTQRSGCGFGVVVVVAGRWTRRCGAVRVQVREEEVEEWVVDAIRLGLIDARMDQSRQEVRVASAIHREFGPDQWPKLQHRLHLWRDNVAAYLRTLQAMRTS